MGRLILVLLLAAASAAAGDIVLLLEDTPGMEMALRELQVPELKPGDRMAVMSFSRSARARQEFTDDQRQIERAVRGIGTARIGWPGAQRTQSARIYAALGEASQLLGSAGGTVVLVFGSEDRTGRPAPGALNARLYAVGVRKSYPVTGELRNVQTPPTNRGRAPVNTLSDPLPEATLEALRPLARATGGEVIAGRWSLPKLVADHATERP